MPVVTCPWCSARTRVADQILQFKCPKCAMKVDADGEPGAPALPWAEPVVIAEEVPAVRAVPRRRREAEEPKVERSSRERPRESVQLDERFAFVATARVEINGTVYALPNITSARLVVDYTAKIVLILLGCGLGYYAYTSEAQASDFSVWAAGIFFLLGLVWPGSGEVRLVTAGGEVSAYKSLGCGDCKRLLRAIQAAMIERV